MQLNGSVDWLTYLLAVVQQIHLVAETGRAGHLDAQIRGPSSFLGQELRMVRLSGFAQHRNLWFPSW